MAGGERQEGVGRRAAAQELGQLRGRGAEPKGGGASGGGCRRRAKASRGAAEFGSLPASGSVALLVLSEIANEREWGRQREL